MTYCTLEDITAQIPEDTIMQATDDDMVGVVDDDKVNMAISVASSLIDGYISGRYSLPLQTVPPLVKLIAVDIVIYKLYERRLGHDMPESIYARYKNSIKLLEQIQKGMIKLGIESPDTGPGQGHYKTNKTTEDRVFSKTKLKGF